MQDSDRRKPFFCRRERRRPRTRKTASVLFIAILVSVMFAFGQAGFVFADNGERVSTGDGLRPTPGSEQVDIAFNSATGEFFVLGANGLNANNHGISLLNEACTELLAQYQNPHPTGAIATNDLTINLGIAVHPIFQRVYILAQVGDRDTRHFRIEAMSLSGENLDAGFDLALGGLGGGLTSLTYNPIRNSFVTVDTRNGRLLEILLDGSVIPLFTLPGKETEDTVLRLTGVTVDTEEQQLYVTYGNVLSSAPTKIIQVTADGELVDDEQYGRRTGIEVPLSQIPSTDIRGIASYRGSRGQRLFAVLGDENLVFHIAQEIHDVIPPTELVCSLTPSNHVNLRWVNNGDGDNYNYTGPFTLYRNGIPFAAVNGETHSFTDPSPVNGESTYAVQASDSSGATSGISCECRTFVGAGGLIDWAMAPGGNIWDITEDPTTGDIYVTDDTNGTLHVLGADLLPNVDIDFESPWDNPGGVAYVPSMIFGFPAQKFTHLLAVANTSDNRVKIIDLDTFSSISTISLRFPDEVSTPQIGGMTYFPAELPSHQRIVVAEKSTELLYFFQPNGNLMHRCAPQSVFLQLTLGCAISYEPNSDTLLAAMDSGIVRELHKEGPPNSNACPIADADFELSLESLGEDYSSPGYISGLQASGNTLLVAVRGLGIISRVSAGAGDRNEFIRGDSNSDTEVNVSDIVFLLDYLFKSGPNPSCDDAADMNDDGRLGISDAVFSLYALFVPGSPTFPDPDGTAGPDPSRDQLSCLTPPTP